MKVAATVLLVTAAVLFHMPTGVSGSGHKSCPNCGMVDYTGLMGSDDCMLKMQVAAQVGASYGITMNGSTCDFATPGSGECPQASDTHCLYMQTCASIEEADAATYGGIYGKFCIHTQMCLRTLLLGDPVADTMPDSLLCTFMDGNAGCSEIDDSWSENGLTPVSDECVMECCEAEGGDCLQLTLIDYMGGICVNTTYVDEFADTSSSEFMALKEAIIGDIFSYATCGVPGYAALSVEGAAEDEMCVDGTLVSLKLSVHTTSTASACDIETVLDSFKDMIAVTYPVQYISMDDCDSGGGGSGGSGSSAENASVHLSVILAILFLYRICLYYMYKY